MDPIENSRAVAQELVSYGREQGVDLAPLRNDFVFQRTQRWIELWRKDEVPCSGPAHEKEGTLHYNLQGAIAKLPNTLKESARAFRGVWTEAGALENIEQAFE